jgi:hypothetical protein
MAKKQNKNLPIFIVVGLVALALILAFAFPGATFYQEETTLGVTSYQSNKISLYSIIFGGLSGTSVSAIGNTVTTNEISVLGGMSYFALISFILLVLGLVLVVASLVVKDKKLDLIGSALLVLAGIFMFLILVAGADITIEGNVKDHVLTFKEMFEEYKLGAGAIIYAILAILAGLVGGFNALKGKK